MKKKFVLLLILITLLSFVCVLIYLIFIYLGTANPKLHTIRIGEEKKLTDIYRYRYEKIVFIGGKNKKDKINFFLKKSSLKIACLLKD